MSHFTIVRRINLALTLMVGLVLVLGGIATALSPPVLTGTIVATILGSRVALVTFGFVFAVMGVTVVIAAIRKRKRLYSYSLMIIYLVCIFTAILELIIVPGSFAWVDNSIIAVVCAYLWIWWKSTTEYIDLRHFHRTSTRVRFRR